MPIGIVSDSDFLREISNSGSASQAATQPLPLTSPTNKEPHLSESSIEIKDIKRGRGNTPETPSEIRSAAAISAINHQGTGKDIADTFGLSPSSVSAYKVGAHSTDSYDSPNPSLLATINDHKEKVSKKARSRLLAALNELTVDKLATAKARDLASIAKDMSSVVKDMEPSVSSSQTNVQFVFMAPRVKDIDDFKIIDVHD